MPERLVDVEKQGPKVLHTCPVTISAPAVEEEAFKEKALEAAGNAKLVPNEELERAVCGDGSSERKPSTTPIEGHLYAGLVRATSVDARSWGPSGGWSELTNPELKQIRDDSQPSRTEVITFDDNRGNPVVVSVSSSVINNQTVEYNIVNLGKTGVRVTLNMPVNASFCAIGGPFSGETINLEEGSRYKNEINVASQSLTQKPTSLRGV